MEHYVQVKVSDGEPEGIRPPEIEVCEVGADCSQEGEPADLSNGKEQKCEVCFVSYNVSILFFKSFII